MALPPTLVSEYFAAIVDNDDVMVRELLDGCDGENAVDINSVSSDGSTALQVALEHKRYELAGILIKRRIRGGLTLLRMIESGNGKAVEYICTKYKTFKSNREDIFSSHSSDDEFPPETTPVTLAARLNRLEILKILLQYGATMPELSDVRRQFFGKRPGRGRAVLQLCEALTSEAYLLQTSQDLLSDIFRIAEQVKDIRHMEKNSFEKLGIRDDYTDVEERLRLMAENVLNFANAEEVETLLKGGDDGGVSEADQLTWCCARNQTDAIPIRIVQAIQMKYKEFVAHKKFQEYLWRNWRSGFRDYIVRSNLRRFLITLLIAVFWPVCSFLYLILSAFNRCEPFLRVMRSSYVKFILQISSRLTFLLVLISKVCYRQVTVFTVDEAVTEEKASLHSTFVEYKTHSTFVPGLIFVWILGMTWRELTKLRDQGPRLYVDIGHGLADMPQIVLYWVYVIFAVIASVQVQATVHEDDWFTSLLSTLPFREICDTESSNCTTVLQESRLDWYAYDPILIAEAAFAIANVLTFIRLLDTTVLIAGLGALQVSFRKMFNPIIKFLSMFAFVWLSFSLGMTQLYRPFQRAMLDLCKENNTECPDNVHFKSLWASLKTFFWMLFGHGSLEYFTLPSNLYFTENMGYVVYALWHVMVMIFLMNILIAMASAVYAKIQANADMEWKFARTKMMSEYITDTAVVPPPFNIIPSTASIVACTRALIKCISKDSSTIDDAVLQRRLQRTVRLEERQQIKASKLTQNYKMISGMIRRRYLRSVYKSQRKISPSADEMKSSLKHLHIGKTPHDEQNAPPADNLAMQRLHKTCNIISSDLKHLQETMQNLVASLETIDSSDSTSPYIQCHD